MCHCVKPMGKVGVSLWVDNTGKTSWNTACFLHHILKSALKCCAWSNCSHQQQTNVSQAVAVFCSDSPHV